MDDSSLHDAFSAPLGHSEVLKLRRVVATAGQTSGETSEKLGEILKQTSKKLP